MVKTISVLGSTGSIGRQTISAAGRLGVGVCAITGNSNIDLIENQARAIKPKFAAVYDEDKAKLLKIALADTNIRIGSGLSGLCEAAAMDEAEAVVTAVSGSIGLIPTLTAIDRGARIALANKETLVCAGEIVMGRMRERGAVIIPVDSEHSAIFQCLAGRSAKKELARILLTASGGPFRGLGRDETKDMTPAQAVSHPNWNMGAKISVDSATMMNKGLEIIEAMHLFSVGPERIKVLIHPQSIIHSMVELIDGSVIAQLGVPDMGLPIQYALTYPERLESASEKLDFTALKGLAFDEPDMDKVPCLALAIRAANMGGTAPAVLSAANEEAVALFLSGRMGFNEIYECVLSALESIEIVLHPDLEAINEADLLARRRVKELKKA